MVRNEVLVLPYTEGIFLNVGFNEFNPNTDVFMKNPVFSIKPHPGLKSSVFIKT